jgi:hypothetical protein
MKVLLALMAMAAVMACLTVLMLVDLVVRFWPVMVLVAALLVALRWWQRRTPAPEREPSPALMSHPAAGRPGVGSFPQPQPHRAPPPEAALVVGDESGLRPPATATGSPTWSWPTGGQTLIGDGSQLSHRGQVGP